MKDLMTYEEARERARQRNELSDAVKGLLVDRLDLPIDPSWITNDQPLFGRGLELDSVDALEVASGMEYLFEVTITDDDVGALGSVNTVVDYIEARGYGTKLLELKEGVREGSSAQ